MKVTANQPFFGSKKEGGMWQVGQTQDVSERRAEELLKLGLVEEFGGRGEKEEPVSAGSSDAADKADKGAEERKTKPAPGPDKTKETK